VPTIQIDARELQLLLDLIKARIEQAENAGMAEDHPSSVLRRSLFKKLMDAYLNTRGTMP
jgi:hypothetical protein